jgi:AI-2 transport protein TqsA
MSLPDSPIRRGYLTTGVWIIAAVAIGLVLYEGASILAPFALAVFIWLIMEGFAQAIRQRAPALPVWFTQAISIVVVLASLVISIGVLRGAVMEFAGKSDLYEARINQMIEQVYGMLGLNAADAPELSTLIFSDTSVRFVEPALSAVQGLAGNLVLVFIYIIFLYSTSATFSMKLDRLYPRHEARERARFVSRDVRHAMEQYLWVQTALSIITTALTYATILALGLDNALFWAFVIFILNYIPTIGSLLAPILPALFAIAQPAWPGWMPDDPMWSALLVFLGVSVWQFVIGNFLGPRMMGESLNISALVVLLSLAVWGALWGLPGMFLSAPLTVLLMIVLNQIPGARWVAIILSDNGNPGSTQVHDDSDGPGGGGPISSRPAGAGVGSGRD